MEMNDELLQTISNETISSLNDISIVTPSIYKSIFAQHATTHNADINDEDKITDTLLDNKILMAQNLQERNSKNIVELSNSTSKAILAIKEKDESTLNKVLEETQELRKEIELLKEAVYKDELTNAFNRKWMHDTFLDENDSFTFTGTLVIIDLNFFKLINDTYGHIIGDKVLIFLTNQLKQTRESVIRYGGDEFVLIFKNLDADQAFSKVNSVREKIVRKKLKAGEAHFRVSFSIGAHAFAQGDNLSNAIELADKNMYDDKVKIKKRITGID